MQRYLDFSAPFDFDPNQTVCTFCILDRSTSMNARDITPTRLEAAIVAVKAMLDEKIKHRPHDKMGIIGFSNKGILVCPLTKVNDHKKISRSLKGLGTVGLTNFVAGLDVAGNKFGKESGLRHSKPGILQLLLGQSPPKKERRIAEFVPHVVFLSDGDHNGDGNPIHAAERLKRLGAIIDCIGIGGTPSDVDEDCLKAMASVDSHGNPRYRFIRDTDTLIQEFQSMATLQVL